MIGALKVPIQRVLILGDSPRLNTGFGKVNRVAANLFKEQGWEIATVAGLTKEPPEYDDGMKTYVPNVPGDALGLYQIAAAVEDFKPDIAYLTSDPGSAVSLVSATPSTVPAYGYIPIEGAPVSNEHWKVLLSILPMMTVSQYGADVLKDELGRDVQFAYHGVDHDVFKVNGRRDQIRKEQHWEDKFIVMCVANNVRRKQIPRLIEAISILKHKAAQKDIILYLHTIPFQDYWLEGWNLPEIARSLGVGAEVLFHPGMNKYQAYVPEVSRMKGYPGLVDMYNAADLFVMPSQVEGFCLPAAEAMACGLPVVITKYAAGWEVVRPAGRGIIPHDWEIHKSGTRYANIDPKTLADEILRLKRNPKERQRMSTLGLERAKDFTWDDFRSKLIPAMEETYRAHEISSIENQGTDKGQEEGNEVFDIPAQEDEDSAGAGEHIIKGKSENPHGKAPQD